MTHIDNVVNVHLQAFPGFFFGFLGKKFVRAFYILGVDMVDVLSFVIHYFLYLVLGLLAARAIFGKQPMSTTALFIAFSLYFAYAFQTSSTRCVYTVGALR